MVTFFKSEFNIQSNESFARLDAGLGIASFTRFLKNELIFGCFSFFFVVCTITGFFSIDFFFGFFAFASFGSSTGFFRF